MSSLVDVVNQQDELVGKTLDSDLAHELNVPHRCVAVYVFDNKGQLYLQVHKKSGGKFDHTVGGHVDAGEDYLTAAKREMMEEIGLEGVELEQITSSYYSVERSRIHVFAIYQCHAPLDWTFKSNEEVEELVSMPLDQVIAKMNGSPEEFTGGFINTMAQYIDIQKLPYKLNHAKITKEWRAK